MCESVFKRADAGICEKRETLDVTILIHRVLDHLHIALTDCLVLDTAKVGGLFLGFSRTIPTIEVVSRDQVGVSRVPTAQATREELYKFKSIPIPLTTWFSQRGREGSELVRERTDGKKEKSTVTHVDHVVTGVTHDMHDM
jgi:hypothetical protein